jgi:hypothetical protein
MTVFCNESMECLPGISSRYILSPLVIVPVAPMTTDITERLMFYIRWIYMYTFLYFNFFSLKPAGLRSGDVMCFL